MSRRFDIPYKTIGYLLFCAFVIVITTVESSTTWFLVLTLCGAIFGISALILGMQIVIWLYHWFAHGHPFYEPGDRITVTQDWRTYEKKRETSKKMCPICKKPTNCRVNRSPRGFLVHVRRD